MHRVGAEQRDQPVQSGARGVDPAGVQRPAQHALAAAGEHRPPAVRGGRDPLQVVDRAALLPAGQVCGGHGRGQPGVAVEVPGQHHQVLALRVGDAVLRPGQPEAELGAEHRRQPVRLGRLGEPDDPVEAIVVGQRQRGQAEAGGGLGQLLRAGGAVEEAEVGVAVQLRVGHRRRTGGPGGPGRAPRGRARGGLVRRAVPGPGRAVPAVAGLQAGVGRCRLPGQRPLDRAPGHRRVGPPHRHTSPGRPRPGTGRTRRAYRTPVRSAEVGLR